MPLSEDALRPNLSTEIHNTGHPDAWDAIWRRGLELTEISFSLVTEQNIHC